jgi:RNA polymerase sigma factor (sigma-70 family)
MRTAGTEIVKYTEGGIMDYKIYNGAREADAFTEVYRKYSRAITRYLGRVVFDRDLAEDLSQDVFVKLFEKNVRLDPESPRTLGYLFAVARNTAIDYLRRKRVEIDKIKSMRLEDAVMDRRFYEDLGNAQLRGEIISTLADVINSFPEDQRRLLIKKNFENRDSASVARDGGTSVYLFKKIEQEFNRRVRDSLRQYFPGAE